MIVDLPKPKIENNNKTDPVKIFFIGSALTYDVEQNDKKKYLFELLDELIENIKNKYTTNNIEIILENISTKSMKNKLRKDDIAFIEFQEAIKEYANKKKIKTKSFSSENTSYSFNLTITEHKVIKYADIVVAFYGLNNMQIEHDPLKKFVIYYKSRTTRINWEYYRNLDLNRLNILIDKAISLSKPIVLVND